MAATSSAKSEHLGYGAVDKGLHHAMALLSA